MSTPPVDLVVSASVKDIPSDMYNALHTIALQDHEAEQVKRWYAIMLQHVRRRANENIQIAYGNITPVSPQDQISARPMARTVSENELVSCTSTAGGSYESYLTRGAETTGWLAADDFAGPSHFFSPTQSNNSLLWRVATANTHGDPLPNQHEVSLANPRRAAPHQMRPPQTRASQATSSQRSNASLSVDHRDTWFASPPVISTPSFSQTPTFANRFSPQLSAGPASKVSYHFTESNTSMPVLERFEHMVNPEASGSAIHGSASSVGLRMLLPSTELFSPPFDPSAPSSPPHKRRRLLQQGVNRLMEPLHSKRSTL